MKRKSPFNTDARKEKIGKPSDSSNTTVGEGIIDVHVEEVYDPIYDKRLHLQLVASCLELRSESYYGPKDEKRTCIWSGGDPFSWTKKTTGTSWIGVNGTESAYVVAMRDGPRGVPPAGSRIGIQSVLALASCDIGIWADTSTEYTEFRRRMIAQRSSEKVGPFAVVSEAPGTKDHLASRAINFLAEKLNNRSALNHGEVKQIAICALKFLLGPKFDAKKIEIMGSGKGSRYDVMMNAFEVETAIGILNAQPFPTPAPAFANNSPIVTTTPQPFGASQSAAFGVQTSTTSFGQPAFGEQHRESISPIPAYKEKSYEELRWESYPAGDKGSLGSGTPTLTKEKDPWHGTTIIGICTNGCFIVGGDTRATRLSDGTIKEKSYRKVHMLHLCGLLLAVAGNSLVIATILDWFRRTYLTSTPRTVTEVAQYIKSLVQDNYPYNSGFIVGGHSIEEKFKMISIKKIIGKEPVVDWNCKFCAIGTGAKYVPHLEDRHTASNTSAMLFTLYGLQLAATFDYYTGGYLAVRAIGKKSVRVRTSKPIDGGEDGEYNHCFEDVTLSFEKDVRSEI